jgi:LysM repeat protein
MKHLLILCFFAMTFAASAMPNDSIGTKTVDGKLFILHKVSKGEGVYGIGKKYGVPAADIFAANEGSQQSIKIGQVLMIPKGESSFSSNSTSQATTTTKTEKVYHTVAKGQTLSLIAKMHNTTIANIKEMNKLKSDNIQLGQKLVVGEKTTTVATTAKPKPAEPVKPVAKPDPVVETPVVKPVEHNNVVVNTPIVAESTLADSPGTINTSYNTDDGDEVSEKGTASISSEGELNQDRSFILHPTAKIGTIVMITNTSNNNTVFARVVGNCKQENGVILKMSKTVASKLGATENTEVKVSYAK